MKIKKQNYKFIRGRTDVSPNTDRYHADKFNGKSNLLNEAAKEREKEGATTPLPDIYEEVARESAGFKNFS